MVYSTTLNRYTKKKNKNPNLTLWWPPKTPVFRRFYPKLVPIFKKSRKIQFFWLETCTTTQNEDNDPLLTIYKICQNPSSRLRLITQLIRLLEFFWKKSKKIVKNGFWGVIIGLNWDFWKNKKNEKIANICLQLLPSFSPIWAFLRHLCHFPFFALVIPQGLRYRLFSKFFFQNFFCKSSAM